MTESVVTQLRQLQAEADVVARLLENHGDELPALIVARLAVELDMELSELAKHRRAIVDAIASKRT